jgi:NAD(P)-dependent dehydrogenase (short-subunit alcohol dehydrogenase family)
MDSRGRLEGKVAIVTGGASGIGEASVRLFASEGASIVIADIQDEKGRQLAEEMGGKALFQHTDVSEESDVERLVEGTIASFGRLDVMFNNAGIAGEGGPIESMTVENFDRIVGVLLRGVFLGVKHAAPAMRRQSAGSIINTASTAGLRAGYGNHIYSAAKAGVIGLTRSVSMELGEAGVRVNCICPGFVPTPMIGVARGLTVEEAEAKLGVVAESFAEAQPMRGPILPEDIARAALWLASDDSRYVNGQAIVVDGGVTGGRTWRDYQRATADLKRDLTREG